ncbi:chemotaxis protein CheY [Desulfocarbo indianensis]|nr:chemotaxis protein CheY [Desulfocarbo indianensis]
MNEPAKILVVDDEPINRKVLEALLKPLGYEVAVAEDGFQCLEMMPQLMPDLVLMDVMMPRMDGFEVTRRLKSHENYRDTPVVIVTALKEIDDRVAALEAGADDFLTKPVDKSELRARVRSLLKVKAYHDHLLNYQRELEAEVNARTQELANALAMVRNASLDTIFRLSRAAEYRDEDTGSHITRMSNYSARLARKLELGEKTAEAILYAAPMHDVGKIGIPDHILLKPGPLEPDEWAVMKTHTIIGSAILSAAHSPFLRLGEVIALAHHEKWDGSGYPRGLKGKNIPLVGRIVAVADVFDALVSRRPYKEPFTVEKSLEIMKEGRGRHFDPLVLDAFLDVFDDILDIHGKYQDEQVSPLHRAAGSRYRQES